MNPQHPKAAEIAEGYIGKGKPLEVLGWGIDGVVYTTPGAMTAIKIHKGRESYDRELAAYKRIKKADLTNFMGFQVPRLIRSDNENCVIEMSIVKAPFLLDFAGTTTFQKFKGDVYYEWWESVREKFNEEEFSIASSVFAGLKREFGLYYWDLKPGNLQF